MLLKIGLMKDASHLSSQQSVIKSVSWEQDSYLVREFYANWDTSFGESTKVKLRGQVVRFSFKSFNAFLGTLVVDPSEYFILLEKPPYRHILHTLCGEHSSTHWARDHKGTHSTLLFSYLNKEAKVWVKLVCAVILPGTHMSDITTERIALVYMLMKRIPINFGEVLWDNMRG